MKWVALITLGLFCVLSSFAWGRVVTVWHPAPRTQVAPVTLWKRAVPTLAQRQAEAYARAYGIDLRHLDNALNIFGE